MNSFENFPIPRDPDDVRAEILNRFAHSPVTMEEVGRIATERWAELPQTERDLRSGVVSMLFPSKEPGDLADYEKALKALLAVEHAEEAAREASELETLFNQIQPDVA